MAGPPQSFILEPLRWDAQRRENLPLREERVGPYRMVCPSGELEFDILRHLEHAARGTYTLTPRDAEHKRTVTLGHVTFPWTGRALLPCATSPRLQPCAKPTVDEVSRRSSWRVACWPA